MKQRAAILLAALLATHAAFPVFAEEVKKKEVPGTPVIFEQPAKASAKEMSGQEVVFDKSKGNCLACHAIPNEPKAEAAGNIAPPFIMMKERFPDRAKLRAQIWDATQANPRTSMPPFGKHKILTEQEIDKVVDYVHSL
jgi:sulfur-oxidizing protein SoxX